MAKRPIFILSGKKQSVRQFFDNFKSPAAVRIIQVTDKDYENSAPESFNPDTLFWVFDKILQKRAVFRAKNDSLLSIAFDSPAKFHFVYRHTEGPPMTLTEMFRNARNLSDVTVALDDDPDLVLSRRPDLSDPVAYGELKLVSIEDEQCLLVQLIRAADAALDSQVVVISTRAPLFLDAVVGIKRKSSSEFRRWMEALREQQQRGQTAKYIAGLSSMAPNIVLLSTLSAGQDVSLAEHACLLHSANVETAITKARGEEILSASDDNSTEQEKKETFDIQTLRQQFEAITRPKELTNTGGSKNLHLQMPKVVPQRYQCSSSSNVNLSDFSSTATGYRSQSLTREKRMDLVEATLVGSTPSPSSSSSTQKSLRNEAISIAEGSEECNSDNKMAPPILNDDEFSNSDNDAYESINHLVDTCEGLSVPMSQTKPVKSESFDRTKPRPRLPSPRAKRSTLQRLGLRSTKQTIFKYEAMHRAPDGENEYAMLRAPDAKDPERCENWKDASRIPRDLDVASLTVGEVFHCLRLLKLKKYARKFRERVVDGAVLVTLNEAMLVDSFKMDQLDARKLVMFARENWRPSK